MAKRNKVPAERNAVPAERILVPPSRNRSWGFWGTLTIRGLDPAPHWQVAVETLVEAVTNVSPDLAAATLDARVGRHLADTLQDAHLASPAALRLAIVDLLSQRGWWHEVASTFDALSSAPPGGRALRPGLDAPTEGEAALFWRIARERLGIETLRTRRSDSLDFHEVAVWSVETALREAYEAGRAAGRKERR